MHALHTRYAYLMYPTLCALFCFSLFSFWGIRSPDCEVSYRTAVQLAHTGSFGLEEDLKFWPEFGLPKGVDGRRYSVFGLLQPMVMVPFVWVADALEPTGWFTHFQDTFPLSNYGSIYMPAVGNRPASLPDLNEMARRAVVAASNIPVSAAATLVFTYLAFLLCGCRKAAAFTGLCFALGTPVLSYAGTAFSEPLTMLCFLLTLTQSAAAAADGRFTDRRLLLGGAFMGLTMLSHVTGLLFLPLMGGHVLYHTYRAEHTLAKTVRAGALYGIGSGLALLVLAYYNYTRFGSPLETGRTAAEMVYATWILPFPSLFLITVGPAKGLLFFAPAAALGLYLAFRGYRAWPGLGPFLIGAFVLRAVVIASRADWHGGYCLGPRLLMPVLPVLILPLATLFQTCLARSRGLFALAPGLLTALLFCQQAFLAMGDVFNYYFTLRYSQFNNPNMFKQLYSSLEYSPLLWALEVKRAPWFMANIPLGNYALWLLVCLIGGTALVGANRRLLRRAPEAQPST